MSLITYYTSQQSLGLGRQELSTPREYNILSKNTEQANSFQDVVIWKWGNDNLNRHMNQIQKMIIFIL